MNLSIQYAERVYSALLSLYPVRFRVRFAPEMAQLFHDCCHDALEKGQVAVLVSVWVAAMRDLLFSLVRERRHQLIAPLGVDHPLIGFFDFMLIPSIVTTNLVVLGPVLTLLVRGEFDISAEQFAMTSGFFSVAIGTLAVVASLIITKFRPTVRLYVKLS
jgi:hypothetical protein